jgi:hypothetical protein
MTANAAQRQQGGPLTGLKLVWWRVRRVLRNRDTTRAKTLGISEAAAAQGPA